MRLGYILLGIALAGVSLVQVQEVIGQPRIEFQNPNRLLANQKHAGFQVVGFSDAQTATLKNLAVAKQAEFQQLLQLNVVDQRVPVLGNVKLFDECLVFEPRFALDPDLTYVAKFAHQQLGGDFNSVAPLESSIPMGAAQEDSKPVGLQVHPSQSELPQNVLRMYLQFDSPMSQLDVYDHIHFLDSSGEKIASPHLEIPQPLWSSDGMRLTLLFDPGRIKRELPRHEEQGYPFQVGKKYEVVVSEDWRSTKGASFKGHRHSFSITTPDRTQPTMEQWAISEPEVSSRQALVVQFDEPLDIAMLAHSLQVKRMLDDLELGGTVRVLQGGQSWSFIPDDAWKSGKYKLIANPRLEDRCGNSLKQPFERRIIDGEVQEPAEATTELVFRSVARRDSSKPAANSSGKQ